MFDIPNAKRVRRNELDSPSSSRASSPDIDILNKLRARTQFDIIEPATAPRPSESAQQDDGSDEELAFNLFAPTAAPSSDTQKAAQVQTIRLRSPTPLDNHNQGFVNPDRDLGHFFTGPVSEAKQAEYAASALSGAEVTALSKLPCPGCAYPWKLIALPSSAGKALAPDTPAEAAFLPDEDRERKRKRLGKKARIKKRVRAEKSRVRKEEAERQKEDKDKADRENRSRKNRAKKLRQRAKEKAKKAAAGGAADGAADAEHGNGSGSDSGSDSDADEADD